MKTTAVVGDLCTHGATIVTGSPTRNANGPPVARMGDTVLCPIHGKNPIILCDAGMPLTDGRLTAHAGSKSLCGATVLPSIFNNPSPASGLSAAEFAIMERDDELEGGIIEGSSPEAIARNRALTLAAKGAEQDSEPTAADGEPVSVATPQGCLDIPENAGASFRLSRYFTLGDLSSGAACARGPNARSGPVVPNMGLNRSTIICNLRHLAVNTLDPIAAKYGRKNMLITSGFRRASGISDHNVGSGVDVQFFFNGVKANGRRLDEIEKEIIRVLKVPFTQIIHENNSWLHFACRRNGQNSAKRICWWAGGDYIPGYRY